MVPDSLSLKIEGPYKFLGDSNDVIFSNEIGTKKGVYLFVVSHQNKYLVYYVGETGKSFIERMAQHVQAYLSGHYHINEPELFAQGKREMIFEGWLNKKPIDMSRLEYFSDVEKLGPMTMEILESLKLFIIPMEEDKRIIVRTESAIANHLYGQPSPIGDFQEKLRYKARTKSEEKFEVMFDNYEIILGLSQSLDV